MLAPSATSPDLAPTAPAAPHPLPGSAGRGQGEGSLPPLPPLSPADRPILLRLIALNENYQALAAELASGSSPCLADSLSRCLASPPNLLDLYAWADQPHIAAWLARHREMTDLQRRTLALDTLQTVIKSSDSPTEKRRAASTILGALDGLWWHRSPSGVSGPGWLARSASGRPSPSHRLTVSPSHPPPPPPISHPVPGADQHAELQSLRTAFNTPQASVALSTIHAHLAHDQNTPEAKPATFAAHPASPDPAEFVAETPSILPPGFRFPLWLSDCKEVERTDTHSRWTLWAKSPSERSFRCTLSLIRDGPGHPNPSWRLATFDILSQSG